MKTFAILVLLALCVAVCSGYRGHRPWGCSRGWRWWGCRCTRYSKATSTCCMEYRSRPGCCRPRQIHNLPTCTNATQYFEDPCDSAKFYNCFGGKLTHFTCPFRGAWNQATISCEKVQSNRPPFCGRRPFMITNFPGFIYNYTFIAVNTAGRTIVTFTDSAPRDTVYTIMAYFAGTRTDFSFASTFNQQFWYSTTCINNVCANFAIDQTYWRFKLNGVVSNVGVSSVIAENNAVIRFELTKFTSN